ncbi:hypothetical protein I0C86_40780 [Plantactinospora sp. S1510]|uniref:Uncharacterized protein n=1 Tax=Plantactinospora alkalitolerans TaxID=2789879 RepID=A0ABS0H9R2_9ACTN|nr:hypothetical protein [Plantactinospora alkalitolerans]MBF9135216.1 hypothetical protein [Plantactinospora alkalitolerans]
MRTYSRLPTDWGQPEGEGVYCGACRRSNIVLNLGSRQAQCCGAQMVAPSWRDSFQCRCLAGCGTEVSVASFEPQEAARQLTCEQCQARTA